DRLHRLAAHLHREGNDGRVAAAERRQRAATEVIRRAATFPGLLIHVAVTVDATGQHQLARGIDDPIRVRDFRSQPRDQTRTYTYVATSGSVGQNDGAAGDGEI